MGFTSASLDNFRIEILATGPAGIPGDFNGDANVDHGDIDLLREAIRTGSTELLFDANDDGAIDNDDLLFHVQAIVGTQLGDANLDMRVDDIDLSRLKLHFGLGSVWAAGNFTSDALIDAKDLAIARENFGFLASPSPGAPEPASVSLFSVAIFALRRQRVTTRPDCISQ